MHRLICLIQLTSFVLWSISVTCACGRFRLAAKAPKCFLPTHATVHGGCLDDILAPSGARTLWWSSTTCNAPRPSTVCKYGLGLAALQCGFCAPAPTGLQAACGTSTQNQRGSESMAPISFAKLFNP